MFLKKVSFQNEGYQRPKHCRDIRPVCPKDNKIGRQSGAYGVGGNMRAYCPTEIYDTTHSGGGWVVGKKEEKKGGLGSSLSDG